MSKQRKVVHPHAPHRRLRRLRDNMNMTQDAFGAEVGMDGAHISMVENGQDRLGVQRALRITDRFRHEMLASGITFEDLIREQH